MATRILYAVTATLPDEETLGEYIAWLEDGHIDAVIEGGARSGMIVRILNGPGELPQVETQYVFATRELFDGYERTAAPALRAEGREKFPPERGITFQRRLGEII